MADERKRKNDWSSGPDDWEDEQPAATGPKVGAGETFLNRAVNALPGGRAVTDAASTAVMQAAKALGVGSSGVKFTPQAQAALQAKGVDTGPESTIPGVVDTYRNARDTRAERTEAGAEQNPWAARFGTAAGIGLSLFAPLPKAPGVGLGSSVATGAGYGALEGLTNGKANLTRGEYGQAALDTLKGGAFGAGMGALGHGAMALGQRASSALRGARADVLGEEAGALRQSAQEGQEALGKEVDAHRQLVGKARGMMQKDFASREAAAADEAAALEQQHGQGLEANKKVDARAARDSDRAKALLDRARRKSAPPEDPSTKVLEGYLGKAEERRALNYDRVRQRQADLNDPALNTNAASENQAYIDKYGHAVNDPARFRREFIERYLRENHGDQVAERLMRERVGQGGEILPRSPTPQGGLLEGSAPKPDRLILGLQPSLTLPWPSAAPPLASTGALASTTFPSPSSTTSPRRPGTRAGRTPSAVAWQRERTCRRSRWSRARTGSARWWTETTGSPWPASPGRGTSASTSTPQRLLPRVRTGPGEPPHSRMPWRPWTASPQRPRILLPGSRAPRRQPVGRTSSPRPPVALGPLPCPSV